ncbi:MAG: diguanylate cyclase, partial [Candidatus Omnitrophota bacterium]
SVIMLDIDYFKSINDVYGHQFGDLVLKQFAKQLRSSVRRYDVVVRFGGEEFVIISPGLPRQEALVFARRLLDNIYLCNFGDRKHKVKIKLSAAVASYPEDEVVKGISLINIVDKVLAKSKEEGGNRVYSSDAIKEAVRDNAHRGGGTLKVKFLKDKIEKLTRRGKQSVVESIFAFAKTLELRDHYTGEHVEQTVQYATELAKVLNLPLEITENIRKAAVLHDLGKIGISDKTLHKKTSLSKKEATEIRKHPQIAADIIRPIQFMRDIIPFILHHHERWDGKGYPAGLKGRQIPIGARIIAVADVYQALTSNRPYHRAYSKATAMKMIKDASGAQFDPEVVDAFLNILSRETK